MELRKTHFIYCVERVDDGRYVFLNRYYKPVGSSDTKTWVDFAAHAVKVLMSTQRASKLSWEGRTDLDRIWLYNDATIPTDSQANWEAYAKRLQLLANFKVKEK